MSLLPGSGNTHLPAQAAADSQTCTHSYRQQDPFSIPTAGTSFHSCPNSPSLLSGSDGEGHRPHSPMHSRTKQKEKEHREVRITQSRGANTPQVGTHVQSIEPVASPAQSQWCSKQSSVLKIF